MASTKVLQRSFTGGEISRKCTDVLTTRSIKPGLKFAGILLFFHKDRWRIARVLPMSITQNTRTKSVD